MTDHLLGGELRAAADRVRRDLPGVGTLVVVGDVMLDRYVDGTTTRLSPEAPVPVVDVTGELDRLGGAANVAAGLAALGASVVLVGLVGDDDSGRRVRAMLDAVPGLDARLVVDAERLTTTKERVRVDGRHIVRIDRERTTDPRPTVRHAIAAATQEALDDAAVLVVSDYAKGTVATGLVGALVDRPCTVVDPKHLDVERYVGADVLAPNRAEAIDAASAPVAPRRLSLDESVRALLARLPGTALVVTCGADGVVWSEAAATDDQPLANHRSLAPRVEDVTGAGDSVVCGLAAALATGSTLTDAIALASCIAAVAVASPGTAAPTWAEIDNLVDAVET